MFCRRIFLAAVIFCWCALAHFSTFFNGANADDWQPINPEELKMTSVPEAPGVPAVYLYRQVDRDDTTNHETNYLRIKILTEEGRKYANIEIPYQKENANVSNVKARTIRPDGTIANYQGKPVEKMIVKAKGVKILAKVLVLPDVQVGSIIEYRFTAQFREHYVFDSHWILSEELFTKHGKFSLKPYGYFPVRWTWQSLPAGTAPPKNERDTVRLETYNVPAFQTEDYMPPENELKSRVDFIYSENNDETQAEKFWKKEGKKANDKVESFIGKKKAMEQGVAQIVSPSDTPEVKLQKIYARVQQIRNTGYEAEITEQEKKRGKEKVINNVEDMWKNGYGTGREITWLFLALARAAGIDAYPMLVSRRNEYFFHPNSMDPHRLDDNVVMVKVDGKNSFYDPGTAFTPFGMLPWPETGVIGLKLDKDGGAWITTMVPDSSVSNIQRKANLKLTDQGSLEGKLTITFAGLEALSVRLTERNEDAAARKKFLEDTVREFIPVGIDVELTNSPEWNSSAPSLVAEYDLKVQGWATSAGRRALIPVGLFGAPEKHVFEHAARVHPIYFDFPTARIDDVTIELPLDWKVSSLPPARKDAGKVCSFNTNVENKQGTLHLTRNLDIEALTLEPKYYGALRNFFQVVRNGDEQQIVVQPGSAAAAN
ncbi:MAG: DUF3857 and transglutaminase domain-containing protein [Acidobacteriota bacterium]|nr:DUF3857 and transglutaminase domain-containing protein [Acidobacteriota bacterium]